MVSIGKFLLLLGAGSFLLHFGDREFKLLMWIDNWGEGIGNTIRAGFIVVGAALLFFGMRENKGEAIENFDDIKTKDA